MKELSDENVYVQDVGHIFFLDIAKNIKEPFEAFMTRTHPQEIDLRNCNIYDSKTSKSTFIVLNFFAFYLYLRYFTFLHATPENL